VSASPLPSPLAIELVDPVRHADPGDIVTFSGVLRNLTADTLWFEGWGWSGTSSTRQTSESLFVMACHPGFPEFCAWPKNPALGPFEATPLMPLIRIAVPTSFEWGLITGSFALNAYPVDMPFRNPDGSEIWLTAGADATVRVGEPPFPEPIPEPATFVLTALGGLVMMCRKRSRSSSS
jgi:hypothetical protein